VSFGAFQAGLDSPWEHKRLAVTLGEVHENCSLLWDALSSHSDWHKVG
jgi:hypothetical protein